MSGAVAFWISFGVALLSSGDTLETLFGRADEALYTAKK